MHLGNVTLHSVSKIYVHFISSYVIAVKRKMVLISIEKCSLLCTGKAALLSQEVRYQWADKSAKYVQSKQLKRKYLKTYIFQKI